jgi:hypothetical protein
MKNVLCITAGLLIASSALGDGVKNPREKAIDAFDTAQSTGTNSDMNYQIEILMKSRYTDRGTTDAVLLEGMCGYAGCSYTYLVTTPYKTSHVNTRTMALAGIVSAATFKAEGTIKKVLNPTQLDQLTR